MLKIIVAMDDQYGIGIQNKLPWMIKEDLKEFKRITLGHSVFMGRKTLDSIGKALSGRINYVLTSQTELPYDAIILIHDPFEFLKSKQYSEDLVFVIGGASLYQLALDYVDELIISKVKGSYHCDAFFPSFEHKNFTKKSEIEFEEFTQIKYARRLL